MKTLTNETSYTIFILGELLKNYKDNDDMPTNDYYDYCKSMAFKFSESKFNNSTKSLYDCIQDFIKNESFILVLNDFLYDIITNISDHDTNENGYMIDCIYDYIKKYHKGYIYPFSNSEIKSLLINVLSDVYTLESNKVENVINTIMLSYDDSSFSKLHDILEILETFGVIKECYI